MPKRNVCCKLLIMCNLQTPCRIHLNLEATSLDCLTVLDACLRCLTRGGKTLFSRQICHVEVNVACGSLYVAFTHSPSQQSTTSIDNRYHHDHELLELEPSAAAPHPIVDVDDSLSIDLSMFIYVSICN